MIFLLPNTRPCIIKNRLRQSLPDSSRKPSGNPGAVQLQDVPIPKLMRSTELTTATHIRLGYPNRTLQGDRRLGCGARRNEPTCTVMAIRCGFNKDQNHNRNVGLS